MDEGAPVYKNVNSNLLMDHILFVSRGAQAMHKLG